MSDSNGVSAGQSGPSAACPDFATAAERTVQFAVELVGGTLQNSPRMLAQVLESDEFQRAVAEALRNEAQALMDEQRAGHAITLRDALDRLVRVAVAPKVRDGMIQEVRSSDEFVRLKRSLEQLGCAFSRTEVGAFVDENKTLLIVTGSIAAIAGAAAMYHFRTGDEVARPLSWLSGKKILQIGRVELRTGGIRFVPSERRVEVGVAGRGRWDRVQADVELSAAFANDQIVGASSKGEVVLRIDPSTGLALGAGGAWSRAANGGGDSTRGDVSLSVRRQISPRANLSVEVFGRYERTPEPGGRGRADAGVQLMFRLNF